MDPIIIHVINGILTEMFVYLNGFKKNKGGILRAPQDILQVWFVSHVKQFRRFQVSLVLIKI